MQNAISGCAQQSKVKVGAERAFTNLSQFALDSEGSAAVVFAVTLPALLAATLFAIDFGKSSVLHAQAQSAADVAALSAADALGDNQQSTAYVIEGKAIAAASGFVDGQNDVKVNVVSPPTSGSLTGVNSAVQVTILAKQQSSLLSWGNPDKSMAAFNIRGQSVAMRGAQGTGCVIALSPTAPNAFNTSGGAVFNAPTCTVYDNSADAGAASFSNNSTVNIQAINVVGNIVGAMPSGTIRTGVAPTPDPYASLAPPPLGACVDPNGSLFKQGLNFSLQPGRYCYGIKLLASQTADLAPGGGTQNITGAIYLPTGLLTYGGGANTNGCTQIVAYFIGLGGTGNVGTNCKGVGVQTIGGSSQAYIAE
jgi:hypothetical protein